MKLNNITDDIRKALKMADQYAEFAPERLLPKDMACDGNDLYEAMATTLAYTTLLFPQLETNSRINLANLIAVNLKRESEDSELDRNNHQGLWKKYKESGLEKRLTPFQRQLMQVFEYEA